MANLFFPQLSSGALVQFPIAKVRAARTIQNILPDGSMILFSDPGAARLLWKLSYSGLSITDLASLQGHFENCSGSLHAFTFIDPTDNMLVSSADLTAAIWQKSSLLTLNPGVTDPNGGTSAFSILNIGQIDQALDQTLAVPSGYQYCFSAYVSCSQAATVSMTRQGSSTQVSDFFEVGHSWSRIISTGRLVDSGTTFTAQMSIPAGLEINVFGLQLEAQLEPSEYRPTGAVAGVYCGAHWATAELTIVAEAPDLYATSFSIVTNL